MLTSAAFMVVHAGFASANAAFMVASAAFAVVTERRLNWKDEDIPAEGAWGARNGNSVFPVVRLFALT